MLNLHFTYSISRCFHSLYYSFHIPFRPYPPCHRIFLSIAVFIFRSLFSVFKSSARRARRCTLLFALLLINSFRKQIFTCMRSIEAIYIILVCECVCVFWKRILHQFIMCRVFSSRFIYHIPYTSIGSLNVTINSDEFVDMLSASMRHSYVMIFFPSLSSSFSSLLLFALILCLLCRTGCVA